MQITKNRVATIHYELTTSDGIVVDSTQDSEPMAYLHGHDNIIPGLEKALEGKKAGDKLVVTVLPGEGGYGEYDDALLQQVPRADFEGIDNLNVGMRFRATTDVGEIPVTIADIQGDAVIVDANHPLAGLDLNFDVSVVDVRNATPEELEHGHVHDPSGGHHAH